MTEGRIEIAALPAWLLTMLREFATPLPNEEARMHFVIELARRNIEESTGGPFGAAVFERDSGALVSAGVNVVLASRCSLAHAEMVALAIAQRRLGTHDLGAPGLPAHELVSSCEPCAMCFGAVPWAGVRRLVCGATDGDARAIGFDEGPRHDHWVTELRARGIDVRTEVCREQARAVLDQYRDAGGDIYNAHRA